MLTARFHHRLTIMLATAVGLVVVCGASFGLTQVAQANPVVYGFPTSDEQLSGGMAASYQSVSAEQRTVARSAPNDAVQFAGIVLNTQKNAAPGAGATTIAYLATTGTVNVYVSTLNGKIHKGDYLTVSPLRGILMRSTVSSDNIVGVALADSGTQSSVDRKVTLVDGTTKTVQVTQVLVDLDTKDIIASTPFNEYIFGSGYRSTNKAVDIIRLIAASIVLVTVLTVEIVIIYVAVTRSIVSAGRNPLAQKLITRVLLRVFMLAVAILVGGLLAIYLILRL